MVSEITAFTRTDRGTAVHGYTDPDTDPDQDEIYFKGSETLPPTCYILFRDYSIPLYGIDIKMWAPTRLLPILQVPTL